MVRKLFAAAVLGLFCTAVTADEPKKPEDGAKKRGGFDRGKLFEKMDKNGDGKVTKEEADEFAKAAAEKLGDKAKGAGFDAGKLFERLDANKDGVVTKDEFEKAGPPAGGFKGKKRPDADK